MFICQQNRVKRAEGLMDWHLTPRFVAHWISKLLETRVDETDHIIEVEWLFHEIIDHLPPQMIRYGWIILSADHDHGKAGLRFFHECRNLKSVDMRKL